MRLNKKIIKKLRNEIHEKKSVNSLNKIKKWYKNINFLTR